MCYNWELQGLVNYYSLAANVSNRLQEVKYVYMQSLVKTLASKHKRLFEVLCGANQLACQLGALFGVRGSGFGVRDFYLFRDYRLSKNVILRPEFRIPLAAQIGVSSNKYIVDHTVLCLPEAGKAQRAFFISDLGWP